jgi:hypothetical protein
MNQGQNTTQRVPYILAAHTIKDFINPP